MILKAVIALCGKGNTGKTTSLNIFAELLEREYKFQLLKCNSDEPAFKNHKERDCNYVFYDDEHKRKIVITTGGDTGANVDSNFDFLLKNVEPAEEVIWVCATRAKDSGSVSTLYNLISEHKIAGYWIVKPYLWKTSESQPYDAKLSEMLNTSSAELLAETYFLF